MKQKVKEYWHDVLATEAFNLDSLRFFDFGSASLSQAHPIWTGSVGNSYECCKSTVLARMVSGRYRCETMCRFWSTNKQGFCQAPTCHEVPGDLEHLLTSCPSLEHTRHQLHSLWCRKTAHLQPLHFLILQILGSKSTIQVKFILDCLSFPQLVHLINLYGQSVQSLVFYLARTWAYCTHREKQILMGKWPNKITNYNSVSGMTTSHTDDQVHSHTSSSPDLVKSQPETEYVHPRDKSPPVVPRPSSDYPYQARATQSSDVEVDLMGPGLGGGPAAPGGRLYGGGGLQLSVPMPVSLPVLPMSTLALVQPALSFRID